MIDLRPYEKQLHTICRELSLAKLDLVGSAARADFSGQSDIDVIVTFEGNKSLFNRYFTLKERLEDIFGRPVDVIEERAISNPYFRNAVDKDRVRIYGA